MEGKINLSVDREDCDKLIGMFRKNAPVNMSFSQNGSEVSINVFFVSIGTDYYIGHGGKAKISIETKTSIEVKAT